MDNETLPSAWASWCARLDALGQRVAAGELPGANASTPAEGARHLTRLLRIALELEVEHGDPLHPAFVAHERLTAQWGGPNPDNVYWRSAVDPAHTYRVWGDLSGVEHAIFGLAEGDMALLQFGVHGERSLDELELGPDGRIELWLSPEERSGNWIPMHPDAHNCTVRLYQVDWSRDPAPGLHIERIGGDLARPLPDAEGLEAALDRAMTWVERSVTFWADYLEQAGTRLGANQLAPPTTPPGGATDISYGGGMWDLGAGEALLVTCDVPDAAYWNFTIHTVPWFESGDFGHRQTSLNQAQTHVDADGRLRLVVAHEDPGVPNWIDTEGRRTSMLTYRWIWARSKPVPTAEVVPLPELWTKLPGDHPTVTPEQRRAVLAARAEAVRARGQ